jgi:hypothetical protein
MVRCQNVSSELQTYQSNSTISFQVWLVKIPPRVRRQGVDRKAEKTLDTTELPLRDAFEDPSHAMVVDEETPRKVANIWSPLYASSVKTTLPPESEVLYRGSGLLGLPTIYGVSI